MPWEFTLMDRVLAQLVKDGATEETIKSIESLRSKLTPSIWMDYSLMLSHSNAPKYLGDNVVRKQQFANSQQNV